LIENGLTRPDFYLDDGRVCIYVDGPHHQHPDRQMVDDRIRRQLRNRGYQVVVVTTPDLWRKEIAEHRDIFGSGGVRT
jgi:very-short-patch-repair endonuclease